jgi:5'-nucleotidase
MILLHDLDGTHVDWQVKFDSTLRSQNPGVDFPFLEENLDWDMTKTLDEQGVQAVRRAMETPGFYADLQPYEGSVEAIHALENAGHTNFFVSSPYINNATCASDKFDSVKRHYGIEFAKRLILTNDKTTVRGDILFDDKPEIKGAFSPVWEHVIFEQSYNRAHVGDRQSIRSWHPEDYKDVVDPVKRYLRSMEKEDLAMESSNA